MNITLGQVVYSKAGRDSGRKFVIVGIIDENYVLVSDGDLRRIEKAKKKKIKHIEVTENVLEQLGDKLKNNQKVANSDIRKAMSASEGITTL